MKKILFLSSHYYFSKRKAGFHFLANSFLKKGYEVTFVTLPFSFLKVLSRDHKLYEKGFIKNIFKPIKKENITSYVNFTVFHPTPKKYFNDIHFGFFLQEQIKDVIKKQDIIVFESNQSLFFYEEIEELNQKAKKIYRVSDDVTLLDTTNSLKKKEEEILKKFDLVSVPAQSIFDRLIKFTSDNIYLHYHGIDKKLFDDETKNPYSANSVNIVFVGNSYFDYQFLDIASDLFPEYIFHIIGPIEIKKQVANVKYYGQMKFIDTIKFIKFADIGLQTLLGEEKLLKTLTDSLKVHQYTYCNLPIVAPSKIKSSRENWFNYELTEESIKNTILDAIQYSKIKNHNLKNDVISWYDLADRLVEGIK